jgi:hypothetical protein
MGSVTGWIPASGSIEVGITQEVRGSRFVFKSVKRGRVLRGPFQLPHSIDESPQKENLAGIDFYLSCPIKKAHSFLSGLLR